MKHFFRIFALLFLCIVLFCACDGQPPAENDSPATCEHRDADDNALCDKCGENYTDDTDVTPQPPAACEHRDADDNALCDKCGESYTDDTDITPQPPAHTHEWSAWSVTTPATCQAKGVESRGCACGENETRDIAIDPDAHTPSTVWTSDDTHHWQACTHTGCTAQFEKAAHTYGDWAQTVAPTCQAKGVEVRSCACGEEETRDIAIDPDAHTPSTAWTSDGTHHWQACTHTGCTAQFGKATHTYGNWAQTVASTCQAKGVEARTCACGHSETRPVDKNMQNHAAWSAWSVITAPSCQAKGEEKRTCACGHSETRPVDKNMQNHAAWGAWSVITAPTCQAKGKEKRTCTCGHSETRDIAINPNAHIYNAENICSCGHYQDTGLVFTLENGTYTVTSYKGSATSVNIPSKYKGIAVTSIGFNAFKNCTGLTSITIPNSVSYIWQNAFANCTGLRSITIPDSVKCIYPGAFYGCSALESITLPFVGERAKSASDTYQYPFGYIFGAVSYTGGVATEQRFYESGNMVWSYTYYIPATLKSVTITGGNILYGAFYNCSNLTSITIPSSSKSIGSYAFYKCTELTSITIPSGVTSIGEHTFEGCSCLTSITIADGNTKYHSANNCVIETESKTLILGCKNSVIPSDGSVTSIGDSAFYGCTGLTSIAIPGSVKSIGKEAFENCTELTSVTIDSGVTSIGSFAFYGCKGLTSIEIPDSVSSIDWFAFAFCSELTSVPLSNKLTRISSCAFYYCSGLTSITIPDSVTSIGEDAFHGCSNLTSITIPNTVTSIGQGAFNSCRKLSSMTLPFVGEALTGTSNTDFDYIFGDHPLVKTVVITGGKISSYAFQNCTSLTSVIIGNGVSSIGYEAFDGCYNLTSVTIGNGVSSIGLPAFSGCSKLTEIKVAADNPTFYVNGNCLIHTASKTLIAGCKNSVIPADGSVTSIGKGAFQGSSLTSISIPDTVTKIDSMAFFDCESLISVTIGSGLTHIIKWAFCGCDRLTSIKYRGSEAQWKAISKDRDWEPSTNSYTITFDYTGE